MSCNCCTGPLSTQTCPSLQCCGGQSCVVPGTCTADGGDDGDDDGGPGPPQSSTISNAKLLKPNYTDTTYETGTYGYQAIGGTNSHDFNFGYNWEDYTFADDPIVEEFIASENLDGDGNIVFHAHFQAGGSCDENQVLIERRLPNPNYDSSLGNGICDNTIRVDHGTYNSVDGFYNDSLENVLTTLQNSFNNPDTSFISYGIQGNGWDGCGFITKRTYPSYRIAMCCADGNAANYNGNPSKPSSMGASDPCASAEDLFFVPMYVHDGSGDTGYDHNPDYQPLIDMGAHSNTQTSGMIWGEEACNKWNQKYVRTYLKLGNVSGIGTKNEQYYLTGNETISDDNPFSGTEGEIYGQTLQGTSSSGQWVTTYNSNYHDFILSLGLTDTRFFVNSEGEDTELFGDANSLYKLIITSNPDADICTDVGSGWGQYHANLQSYHDVDARYWSFYMARAGCTDPAATNYNDGADIDNGSCEFTLLGCTDPDACNYGGEANFNYDSATQTYNPTGVNQCATELIANNGVDICPSCVYNLQDADGNLFANSESSPSFTSLTFGDLTTAQIDISYELNLPTEHLTGTGVNWYWTVLNDNGTNITFNDYEVTDGGGNPTAGTTNTFVTFDVPDISAETTIQLGLRGELLSFPLMDVEGFSECGIVENWPGDMDGDTVVDYYSIDVTLTNEVEWGCRDTFADNYSSTATIDDGSCAYFTGENAGGYICNDANATNYFCYLHENLPFPCSGVGYDADNDQVNDGTYNLDFLHETNICDCDFPPTSNFEILTLTGEDATVVEVNERDVIILRDISGYATPNNAFYNTYVEDCSIVNNDFHWILTDTDGRTFEYEVITTDDINFQIQTFEDSEKLYGGGGEIDITLEVTNSPTGLSDVSRVQTVVVNDIDLPPLIDYPDIYLRGDREANYIGVTLLTEEINQYEFNDLLNNSYYTEDGSAIQSYTNGDSIFFQFGQEQESPTGAIYQEDPRNGLCDGTGYDGNPDDGGEIIPEGTACDPSFEYFLFNCGVEGYLGVCNPITQWVILNEDNRIFTPGQGMLIRVQNSGIIRWGVEA